MTPERREKIEKISLFKSNKFSYGFTLGSVISELAHTIMILDVIESDNKVFVVVMLNICILFGIFYIAVKENVYSKLAAFSAILLSGYLAVRTFVIDPVVLKPVAKAGPLMVLDIITIALLLIGAVKTIDISTKREKYLKEAV